MNQYIFRRGLLALVLLGLVSSNVFAAKVGYYEMCDGEGRPWAVTTISAAGQTPVYLADLAAADLQGLDVLFVTNCSNTSYGGEYLARLPEVSQAVQNGLVLLIHDRWVTPAASILPGGAGIQSVRSPGRDINVVDNSTLVTNGPGGVITNTNLDNGVNSEHGYLLIASLPSEARVILSRPDPAQSVVSVYDYGQGSVIYSTIPLDAHAGILPVCVRMSDPGFTACLASATIYGPNVVAFAAQLANRKPVAKAGVDQSVDELTALALDASASSGKGSLSYKWTQLSPLSPLLQFNSTSAKPGITAPAVDANTTFTLQLTVTDSRGTVSDPDTVDITVKDVNTPPVADAGNNFTIKAGATAILDGSHSYDADGDALTYQWSQIAGPAVQLDNPIGVKPGFAVPNAIGQQLVFALTVSDGKALSQAGQVMVGIVDNAAPLADAGVDQTRDEGNIVALNALASTDPENDGLLFDWLQVAGPKVELNNPGSPTPFFTAPRVSAGGVAIGFAVTVTDTDALNPKSSVDQVVINVRNINDPPACELARPSVASLWPPNHKMRPISIAGVSDTDSLYKDVVLVIDSVTSDEPVVGRGSGHSSPDAVIQAMTPADSVLLRAERKGHGNGRVYQVNFTASDGFESCTGQVQVTVPESRHSHRCDDDHGKHKGRESHQREKHCQAPAAVDDGQNYDATEQRLRQKHGKQRVNDKLAELKAKREAHKKDDNDKKKNSR